MNRSRPHSPTLVLPLAVGLALAAPDTAAAGGGPTKKHAVHATVRVRYDLDAIGDGTERFGNVNNGTLRARGVFVGAFTHRNALGAPQLLAQGHTDADGAVDLRFQAEVGARIHFEVRTSGEVAKTWRGGPTNPFQRPHADSVRLSAAESKKDRIVETLEFEGVMNRALMVQDAGTRTIRWGRRTFGSLATETRRIGYAFPGFLGSGSYAPFRRRAVIQDAPHDRSIETIQHETFHTFWYQARGRVEYYLPIAHRWDRKTGNAALAMSEGWAYYMAIAADNAFARAQGRAAEVDDDVYYAGERHPVFGDTSREDYRAWGQDSEVNVLCALWDLTDTEADSKGVARGATDRANGQGGLPSGEQAMRAIYRAVRESRGDHPTFRVMWEGTLRARWGTAGREACRLNGIALGR